MQLKKVVCQGPRFPLRGHRFPYRPSVPLTGALFNCPIVGHSPGFNCIGPRGASKSIGLGQTSQLRHFAVRSA